MADGKRGRHGIRLTPGPPDQPEPDDEGRDPPHHGRGGRPEANPSGRRVHAETQLTSERRTYWRMPPLR